MCVGAIAYGYSNVFVTAPSPENLKAVFEFLITGLVAVKFKEHIDFEVSFFLFGVFLSQVLTCVLVASLSLSLSLWSGHQRESRRGGQRGDPREHLPRAPTDCAVCSAHRPRHAGSGRAGGHR
jgi:hypothetical protein